MKYAKPEVKSAAVAIVAIQMGQKGPSGTVDNFPNPVATHTIGAYEVDE